MDNDTSEARSVSRRGLVKAAAGAAAVGAGAVAVARIPAATGHGTAPAARDAAAATPQRADTLPKQDWAVYVRDADSGDLDVFVGTQHFAVHDSDLVARLVAAAK
jgi:hypothetical protein